MRCIDATSFCCLRATSALVRTRSRCLKAAESDKTGLALVLTFFGRAAFNCLHRARMPGRRLCDFGHPSGRTTLRDACALQGSPILRPCIRSADRWRNPSSRAGPRRPGTVCIHGLRPGLDRVLRDGHRRCSDRLRPRLHAGIGQCPYRRPLPLTAIADPSATPCRACFPAVLQKIVLEFPSFARHIK